jgi:hypothetical protein
MANHVQHIRFSTTIGAAAYLGYEGEVTIDLQRKSISVHDAIKIGGYELLRSDLQNLSAIGNTLTAVITQIGAAGIGMLVKTAASAYTSRSLAVGVNSAAELVITNPAGTAGNPTFDLFIDIAQRKPVANFPFLTTDRGNLVDYQTAGIIGTLPLAATLSAPSTSGWYTYVRNQSLGNTTLTSTGPELIDGQPSIILAPGISVVLIAVVGGFTLLYLPVVDSVSTQTGTSDIVLTASSSNIQRLNLTADSKNVKLPDATTMKVSKIAFELANVGSFDIGVQDFTGVLLVVLKAGGSAFLSLTSNSSAAGEWKIVGNGLVAGRILGEGFLSGASITNIWDPAASRALMPLGLEIGTCGVLSDTLALVPVHNSSGHLYMCAVSHAVLPLTIGPATAIDTSGVCRVFQIFALSATSAIVFYQIGTGTSTKAIVVSVAGTSITFGAATTLIASGSNNGVFYSSRVMQLDTSTFVFALEGSGVAIVTVSGSVVSIGAFTAFTGVVSNTLIPRNMYKRSTTTFLCVASGVSESPVNCVIYHYTVSGTTITENSRIAHQPTGTDVGTEIVYQIYELSPGRFVSYAAGGSTNMSFRLFTLTGTTLALVGSAVTVTTGAIIYKCVVVNTTTLLFGYFATSPASVASYGILVDTGTGLTFTRQQVYNTALAVGQICQGDTTADNLVLWQANASPGLPIIDGIGDAPFTSPIASGRLFTYDGVDGSIPAASGSSSTPFIVNFVNNVFIYIWGGRVQLAAKRGRSVVDQGFLWTPTVYGTNLGLKKVSSSRLLFTGTNTNTAGGFNIGIAEIGKGW